MTYKRLITSTPREGEPRHRKMRSNIRTAIKGVVFAVLCITGTLFTPVLAQQRHEIGAFIGTSYYNGDINPSQLFRESKPAFGAFFRHNLDSRISYKISANYGGISGTDYLSNQTSIRNASFSASIIDLGITGEFNFYKFHNEGRKHRFTPFLFFGIGSTYCNGHVTIPIKDESNVPYQNIAFTIPFGFGAKISLSPIMSISVEWGYRKTFTDRYDGLQRYYYDKEIDKEIADKKKLYYVQMSNPDTFDWVSFAGVTLAIDLQYFNPIKCKN